MEYKKEAETIFGQTAVVLTDDACTIKRLQAEGRPVVGIYALGSDPPACAAFSYGYAADECPPDPDPAYLSLAAARCLDLPRLAAVTKRLLVREFTETDKKNLTADVCGQALSELLNDAASFAAYKKYQYDLFSCGMWGLFLKKDSRPAGAAGIYFKDGEFFAGYHIRADLRGQGLAFEAMSAILELFEGEKVYAQISAGNLASRHLAEKLGFRLCPPGQSSPGCLYVRG